MLKIAAIKEYPLETLVFPTRGTEGSAGLDFYIPKYSKVFEERFSRMNKPLSFYLKDGNIVLQKGERICIPSGFKVAIEPGTAFVAWEKSGLATKYGIVPTAKVCDEDYQGEIGIGIMNVSDVPVALQFGQKITQFVHIPVIKDEIEIVDEDVVFDRKTERGEGGYGSTGL